MVRGRGDRSQHRQWAGNAGLANPQIFRFFTDSSRSRAKVSYEGRAVGHHLRSTISSRPRVPLKELKFELLP
jgi:hypothetical protein